METMKLNLNRAGETYIKLNRDILNKNGLNCKSDFINRDKLIKLIKSNEHYYEAVVNKDLFNIEELVEMNPNIIKFIDHPSGDLIKKAIKCGVDLRNIKNLNSNIIDFALDNYKAGHNYARINDKLTPSQELMAIAKSKSVINKLSEDRLILSLYSLLTNTKFFYVDSKCDEYSEAIYHNWRWINYLLNYFPDQKDKNAHELDIMLGIKNSRFFEPYYKGSSDLCYLYWADNFMKYYPSARDNWAINFITACKGLNVKLESKSYMGIQLYNNPISIHKYATELDNKLIYLAVYRDHSLIDVIEEPTEELIKIANNDNSPVTLTKNNDMNLIRICESPEYILKINKPSEIELNLAFFLNPDLLLNEDYKIHDYKEYYYIKPELLLMNKGRKYTSDYLYAITSKPSLALDIDVKYVDDVDLVAYALMLKPELILHMNNPCKLYKTIAILNKPSLYTAINDNSDDMQFVLWLADESLYNTLCNNDKIDKIIELIKQYKVSYRDR